MLSMSKGYDPGYLTQQVATGREGYYLSATGAGGGEPPGRWTGRGCAELGLTGLVDNQVMTSVYTHLLDPRDPSGQATLGKAPRRYKSAEQIAAEMLAAEPDASPQRVAEIEVEAAKRARSAVMFFDLTFSPAKSVSLLHAGFQAAAVEARRRGDVEEAARLDAQAEAVWAAVRTASAAAMDYLQDVAGYTRTGYHGAIPRDPVTGRPLADHSTGRFEAAHEWVIASFDQHTSRAGDPQLHIHNAVLNRVKSPDGEYRTLDSRAIFKARPAAAAIAERVLEEQLTRDLGVQWAARPDGQGREIVGIDERTREAFSSRRVAIRQGVAELVEAFKAKHGCEPSRRAVFHMAQFVTVDSRAGKSAAPAPSRENMLARWEAQATAAELGALAGIPEAVVGRAEAREAVALAEAEIRRVCEAAVAQLEAERATWTRHHLMVAINRHLPDTLGGLPAETVRSLLVDLTEGVLAPGAGYGIHRLDAPSLVREPAEWLREDGSSLYGPVDRARYATERQLGLEERLIAAAARAGGPEAARELVAAALGAEATVLEALLRGESPERVRQLAAAASYGSSGAPDGSYGSADGSYAGAGAGAYGSSGRADGSYGSADGSYGRADGSSGVAWRGGLRDDQAAAVYGILTSGRRIDVLIGPAGAGKSRAMGELSELWREQVGGRVVGLAVSQNAAEVLAGEGCQHTANVAAFLTAHRTGRAPLREGDLVVVDEASMISGSQLAEINVLAERAGAKILLTGDPEQLAAVGNAGAMALLSRDHGFYQLTEVQRMRAEWERRASLLLRQGDEAALHLYDAHGRLLEGSGEQMTEQAYRRWLGDHLAGRSTMLLAPTVAEAHELAARARAELVDLGLVEAEGVTVRGGQTAGVGDRVMARTNSQLVTDAEGRRVTNRDVLVIDEWIGSPDPAAEGPVGARVRRELGTDAEGRRQWSAPYAVPVRYLAEHAELAYASTVHAAQGRTVDTCHAVVRPGVDRAMLYVMMTRGRDGSFAYVATDERTADMDPRAAAAPEIAEAARAAEREAAGVPEAGEGIAAVAPEGRARYAVLADALATEAAELTATEVLRDEHLRATHLGHLGVLWAEATRQATTRRFDAALEAMLTPEQYERYTAREEAGARSTLARLVRAAELAGRDPVELAASAVTGRAIDPDGSPAESIAKVLHYRIKTELGTDKPQPRPAQTFAERTPAALDDHPAAELVDYAQRLAAVMDDRSAELGAQVAERAPEWAVRHLGPVPGDVVERLEWERKAAAVAAYREQYDRLDEAQAIGHCPNTPEGRAAWHTAFDALGRPEVERPVAAMSTGELLVEYEHGRRVLASAPERVADELREVSTAAGYWQAETQIARARLEAASGDERAALADRVAGLEALVERYDGERHVLSVLHEGHQRFMAATEKLREKVATVREVLAERFPEAELPPLWPEPLAPKVSLARETRQAREARQVEEAGREEAQRQEAELVAERDEPRVHEGQLALDFAAAAVADVEARQAEQAAEAERRAEADRERQAEEAGREEARARAAAEAFPQAELDLGFDVDRQAEADRQAERQREQEEAGRAEEDARQAEARVHEGQLALDFAAAERAEAERQLAEDEARARREAAERQAAERRAEEDARRAEEEKAREAAERYRQAEVEHGLDRLPDGTRVDPEFVPLVAKVRQTERVVEQAERQVREDADRQEREQADREAEDSQRAVRQRAERRRDRDRARSRDLDEEGREQ